MNRIALLVALLEVDVIPACLGASLVAYSPL